MTAKLSDPERDHAAQIVARFSVLIHAWQTNDFHEAARARDELERLGVKVRIQTPLIGSVSGLARSRGLWLARCVRALAGCP